MISRISRIFVVVDGFMVHVLVVLLGGFMVDYEAVVMVPFLPLG